MDRKGIVLAALAPANGDTYTPVQVQKLLFLIDQNIATITGGQHFNFEPYDYGPFDKEVYSVLHELEENSLVEVLETPGQSWKRYRLTKSGQTSGKQVLGNLDPKGKDYITRASEYVRDLSFSQLVSAIYKAYPHMKANSVF